MVPARSLSIVICVMVIGVGSGLHHLISDGLSDADLPYLRSSSDMNTYDHDHRGHEW